jgi:hypothetical protein
VDRAVAAARAAQPQWARRSASERAALLHRLADAVTRDGPLLKELERSCTGKVPSQLQLELDMSVAYLRYYAGAIHALSGRTIDQGSSNHTYTKLEPYGVVGVITPGTCLQPGLPRCRPCAGGRQRRGHQALEFTPLSTLHLARLATEAGLPAGVLNVVVGTGSEVGAPLVRHPDVRRIAFTGSVAAGRQVAASAGERLIPPTPPSPTSRPPRAEAQFEAVLAHLSNARATGCTRRWAVAHTRTGPQRRDATSSRRSSPTCPPRPASRARGGLRARTRDAALRRRAGRRLAVERQRVRPRRGGVERRPRATR